MMMNSKPLRMNSINHRWIYHLVHSTVSSSTNASVLIKCICFVDCGGSWACWALISTNTWVKHVLRNRPCHIHRTSRSCWILVGNVVVHILCIIVSMTSSWITFRWWSSYLSARWSLTSYMHDSSFLPLYRTLWCHRRLFSNRNTNSLSINRFPSRNLWRVLNYTLRSILIC